ncbi:MAG: radical SAM protein, partial [Myxococcota bacterium]|nr:radical SAM protein [Myxococcota bacterium]
MTRDLASGADVTVTLRCNNRCVFCPRSTLRHISLDRPTELEQRLDAIRKRSDRVILTGGELTVLPEAVELVDSCRRRGFREIALITNGRRLSDLGFTRRLVDAGLTEVCVTVYDLRPAVQDGLTRAAGSLSQTLAGLDNLLAIARERGEHGPLALRINTVLCEANVDGLLPMLREMRGRGLRGFLVADGVLAADGPAPLPVERIRAVASDITRDPALAGADVVWRGFPLCFLDGIEGLVAEPHRIDTADADDRRLDEYQAAFRGHFVRAAACDECTAVDDCSGLQQRFVEHFGEAAARPRSATQFEPW